MNKYLLAMLVCVVPLGGCHQDTDESVSSFRVQKQKFDSIINLLHEAKSIEVVELGMNPNYVPNSQVFDSSTASTYREIEKEISTLNVRKVVAVRSTENDMQLSAVSFVMQTNPLDWSEGWSIFYVEVDNDVKSFVPPNASCRPIDSPSWYMCIYDTN